jgi:hypothetical protein
MGANQQTSVPAFTAGQVLTAQQQTEINTGVPVFADTTARDAAFGGTGEKILAEGQMCYIEAAPKRYQVYNGSAWVDYFIEATTYTPTTTGITLGNGTLTGRYTRLGKMVWVGVQFGLGSTSAITATPSFSLPVNAQAGSNATASSVTILDAGVTFYRGSVEITTTLAYPFVDVANATYLNSPTQNISPTVPMTWANGDNLKFQLVYEAA